MESQLNEWMLKWQNVENNDQKWHEFWDIIHPPTYDKPSKSFQEYCCSNGKPWVPRANRVTLAELKAKAKACGIKNYSIMRKDELSRKLASFEQRE